MKDKFQIMDLKMERLYYNVLLLVLSGTMIAITSAVKFTNPMLTQVFIVSTVTLLIISAKIVNLGKKIQNKK
jgi:hypothetical protein